MARPKKTNGGNGVDQLVPSDVKPPSVPEIEASVLGAMMIEKEAVPKALEMLSAESFYVKAHKIIFEAMKSMRSTM